MELRGGLDFVPWSAVSIPKRVSAKVEPNFLSRISSLGQFQSLKGFQPKWNPKNGEDDKGYKSFQSLKGFQPKWDELSGIIQEK